MVQFDLSSIPAGATISSAVLELNYSGLDDACAYNTSTSMYLTPGSYTVHTVTQSWDEVASVKWATHASSMNNSVEDTYDFTPNTCDWADFDVTTAVSDMVSGTTDNNGFVVVTHSPAADAATNGWGGLWTYFASSDTSDVSIRPKLTVTYSGGTPVLLGKESLAFEPQVKIVDNLVHISGVESTYEGTIFNMQGQHIAQFHGEGNTAALPSKLSVGVYFVSLQTVDGEVLLKTVIK